MKSVFKWRVEKKPLREEEPTESLDRVPRVDEAVKEAEK